MQTVTQDLHYLKYGYSKQQDSVGFPEMEYDDRFTTSSNIMAKAYVPMRNQAPSEQKPLSKGGRRK